VVTSTGSHRLITLIRRLHLAIRAELVDELRARGYRDISAAHIYVFQTPGPDGLRPTELAQRVLMTKQAMNHLLGGLERSGYIERVDAADDGRARVLRLTHEGQLLTELIQQTSADIERRWVSELGPERIDELIADLGQIESAARSD
jgi:DNA-binding MarR family transcriptional regulator